METLDRQREREIFNACLALTTAQRKAFLRQVCAGEPDLRRRIERLIGAHERALRVDSGFARKLLAGEAELSQVGGHRVLKKLGEGGMGNVYLVESSGGRKPPLALKRLKRGLHTDEGRHRFEREQRALAEMSHPYIARLADSNVPSDGTHFAMEYVSGVSIVEFCDEKHWSIEERLRLFLKVCAAVEHAHQKEFLHRDLKPSNILVTESGGKVAPKIIDFGIAKGIASRATGDGDITLVGRLMGTPEYMSPEQAAATSLKVDVRTDVYSLGVVLYELLIGCLPFDWEDRSEARVQSVLRDQTPEPLSRRFASAPNPGYVAARRGLTPTELRQKVDGPLSAIASKALASDASKRYPTASALAGEIERFLRQERVGANRPTALSRVLLGFRRIRRTMSPSTLSPG